MYKQQTSTKTITYQDIEKELMMNDVVELEMLEASGDTIDDYEDSKFIQTGLRNDQLDPNEAAFLEGMYGNYT